ncbi:MAG: alpha/beta hydrolase [Canibacter sp.]
MQELHLDRDVIQWAVDGALCDAVTAKQALAAGRPLLVLMHGYGSFEGDLIQRAPQLPQGFVCASPRAPMVAPAPVVDGFSWFPLSLQDEGISAEEVVDFALQAAGSVTEWIDDLEAEIDAAGGTRGSVVPMGFSQGGVMVTTLLRLHPGRFQAGVNCSGFVAPVALPGDDQLRGVKTPLFWGRDDADPIISREAVEHTAAWAPEFTTLTENLYPGILHGINAQELEDISRFLHEHVPELSHEQ